jgi:hypothetical protein
LNEHRARCGVPLGKSWDRILDPATRKRAPKNIQDFFQLAICVESRWETEVLRDLRHWQVVLKAQLQQQSIAWLQFAQRVFERGIHIESSYQRLGVARIRIYETQRVYVGSDHVD